MTNATDIKKTLVLGGIGKTGRAVESPPRATSAVRWPHSNMVIANRRYTDL